MAMEPAACNPTLYAFQRPTQVPVRLAASQHNGNLLQVQHAASSVTHNSTPIARLVTQQLHGRQLSHMHVMQQPAPHIHTQQSTQDGRVQPTQHMYANTSPSHSAPLPRPRSGHGLVQYAPHPALQHVQELQMQHLPVHQPTQHYNYQPQRSNSHFITPQVHRNQSLPQMHPAQQPASAPQAQYQHSQSSLSHQQAISEQSQMRPPAQVFPQQQQQQTTNAAPEQQQASSSSVLASPELIEYIDRHSREVLHKFCGPPFQRLWETIRETLRRDFLCISVGYLQKIDRLKKELDSARQAEREARQKMEVTVQNSEAIVRKATQWKTSLDQTTENFNALKANHEFVCQVALQQNMALQTGREKPLEPDLSKFDDNALVTTKYLQERVADLESKLKKYEDGPLAFPIEAHSPSIMKMEMDCYAKLTTTVCGSPHSSKRDMANDIQSCSNAVKRQLESEINIVAKLIERKSSTGSPNTATAIKAEPSSGESEQMLLTSPFIIDLTNDDSELDSIFPASSSQVLATANAPPAPLFPELPPGALFSFEPTSSTFSSADASVPTFLLGCPPPIRSLEEEDILKRGDQVGEKEERPRKRPRSDESGLPSKAACSAGVDTVRLAESQLFDTVMDKSSSQEGSEDGKAVDEVVSADKSTRGLEALSQSCTENGEVSSGFAGSDDDDGCDPTPELEHLHMEVLYHRSAKSGGFRCRLCLLEVDAGVINEEDAMAFPADVARDVLIEHSLTAHAQAVLGILQTDKADLIDTIQKLYSSDTSVV